jgi:predicted RNA-binding Zn-ribbon protein involved in translation (DUF1610 family)
MACVHLKQLYQLCDQHGLKISSSDLVRMVCPTCGVQEVCPDMMLDEYDAKHKPTDSTTAALPAGSALPK